MLDNTIALWGNEVGKGNTHTRKDTPFVLAVSCGGYLRTGRYIKFATPAWHNDLWVSVMNAMGVPGAAFGNPATCKGPLSILT